VSRALNNHPFHVPVKVDRSDFEADSLSFMAELKQVFLDTAPGVFEKLALALEREDWAAAKGFAHWLQGGATRMLNPELQDRLREIEKACSEPSPFLPAADFDGLRAAFAMALNSAENHTDGHRAFSANL
jgi:HPt (histidine-containing phosphotransfer) domain-containing protein